MIYGRWCVLLDTETFPKYNYNGERVCKCKQYCVNYRIADKSYEN